MTQLLYEQYAQASVDAKGLICDIRLNVPETFNFGFDVVDRLAEKCPDKTAMVWLDKEKRERIFTFDDMRRGSNRTVNYFKSLGIGKGDRVLLILKRHYQFWYAILALHKLGAVAIPATHLLMTHDIVYRVKAAGIKAVVCTPDGEVARCIEEAQQEAPELQIKCITGGPRQGWEDFDAGIAAMSDRYDRPTDQSNPLAKEPMLMYFTSGTTGYPKIAMHNHGYAVSHIVTGRWWHNLGPDSLHFTMADTGWGKAVWGKLYGQWFCEAAVFTYDFDKFDAADVLPLFAQYKITSFCAPPTIFRFFIKEDLSKYDLSSLRYATIAGEALNPEVYNRFYEATGVRLMEGFGQTETTLTIANLVGMTPKPGSMGRPNPAYDVRLVDGDGNEVERGETGEIVINTQNGLPAGLFDGYYRMPEKTQEVWHDGYYHTGDMAWVDEDGYYWYVGRADDVIKSSGYRIGPFEIESVIMELPYVLECAVTGAPDPIRGQVVKATIVPVKGCVVSEALKKEVQNYVKKHTAPYKYPRIVEFVDALPKTISGKIRRVQLRQEHASATVQVQPLLQAPDASQGEVTTVLAHSRGARVERIVSAGQKSPEGFWYDQSGDEFVSVLQGTGRVEFDDGVVTLNAGDSIVIAAHRRHRVSYTSAQPPCIWLCVHLEDGQ